jgi:hypothetical protein
MSHVHSSLPVRVIALAAVAALAIAMLGVAGCGGTITHPGGPSGNGAPSSSKVVSDSVRGQALDELRSLGVKFDPALVSVTYGNATTRLIVAGPLTGPSKKKAPATKYAEIDLSMQGGTWAIVRTKVQ